MDRSLYPEGVEVHEENLAYTESSKAYHILKRFTDSARMGVVFGGVVTVNAVDNTRFDVSGPTEVYVPNGELCAWQVPQLSNAPASLTAGAVNYVVVQYLETTLFPEAHESLGLRRDTQAVGTFQIGCLTPAQYNGLPATLADYTQVARDRTAIIDIFTAPGGGTLGTAGDPLGQGPLQGPFNQESGTILTAQMPAVPRITGINLIAIAPTTPTGNGTLTLTIPGTTHGAGTIDLQWTAPGDTIGAAQRIDNVTIPYPNNVITLPSGTAAYTLQVEVFPELLPIAQPSPNTDTVVVGDLYSDPAPAFSIEDQAHRHKDGTYIPTQKNPHGLGMQDFVEQVINVVQTMRIGDSFLASTALALLPRIFMSVKNSSSERTLLWEIGGGSALTAGRQHVRIYRSPVGTFEIVQNARWGGSDFLWHADESSVDAQKFEVGSGFNSGNFTCYRQVAPIGGTWGDNSWTDLLTDNGGTLQLGTGFLANLAGALIPRLQVQRAAGGTSNRTVLFQDSGGSGHYLNIYLTNAVTGGSLPGIELVANATWGNDLMWHYGGGFAAKLALTEQGIQVLAWNGNTSPWADTISSSTWRTVLDTDFTNQTLSSGFTVKAGTELTAGSNLVLPRFFATSNPGGVANGATSRVQISQAGTGAGATNIRWYHYGDSTQAGLSTECAIGCHWDSVALLWQPDSNAGSAFLYRYAIPPAGASAAGVSMFYRANTGVAWADSVGSGGWSSQNFYLGQHSTIEDGSLQFTPNISSAMPNSNAAYNAAFAKNALYALNIPKAWAAFAINASSHTVSTLDGFNIATLSLNNFNRGMTVGFTNALSSANYAVVFQGLDQVDASAVGSSYDGNNFPFLFATNKSTTGFQLFAARLNLGSSDTRMIDLSNDAPAHTLDSLRHISFLVFGRMDP